MASVYVWMEDIFLLLECLFLCLRCGHGNQLTKGDKGSSPWGRAGFGYHDDPCHCFLILPLTINPSVSPTHCLSPPSCLHLCVLLVEMVLGLEKHNLEN